MKIKQLEQKNNEENVAVLGCDVSSQKIDAYSEVGSSSVTFQMINSSKDIEKQIEEFRAYAQEAGHTLVRVVAEPTGPYGLLLFRIAVNLGMEIAWVSGEAVAKTRAIENNSDSKNDFIDSKAIYSLGVQGRTICYRSFSEPYAALREWHGIYQDAEDGAIRARTEIFDHLKRLFPDYGFQTDWLYSYNGRVFVEQYGANPYRVVRAGFRRFDKKMRSLGRRVQRETTKRLYEQCLASVRNALPTQIQEILETRVGYTYEDFVRHDERKQKARAQMEQIYENLRVFDSRLPEEHRDFAKTFTLARIIAETGPLSDFDSHKQLLRYAGMDLRVRQSGKFVGKTKISKRGRSALRKVLTFSVLHLVTKGELYRPLYEEMKSRKTPGTKMLMVVARKFLKLLFGLYKSGEQFEKRRVFLCQSEYRQVA